MVSHYAAKKQRQIGCNLTLLRNDVRHYIPEKYRRAWHIESLITELEHAIEAAIENEELDASTAP